MSMIDKLTDGVDEKMSKLHDIADENPEKACDALITSINRIKPVASMMDFGEIDFDEIKQQAQQLDLDSKKGQEKLHELIDRMKVGGGR